MSKTVLIVDDSVVALQMMEQYLMRKGFDSIILAKSGEEGFNAAKSKEVDLAILDVVLPDINGIELCRKIKKEVSDKIKVINITGDPDNINVENQARTREFGADDFVVKTIDYDELLKSVDKVLK